MVTQKELEWRTERSAEDRARTEGAIKDLRDAQVPRQELERVWQSEDQQRAQTHKLIAGLKQGQANTDSARDLLLDTRERQDRLERQIYASRPGGGWRSNISQVIVYRSCHICTIFNNRRTCPRPTAYTSAPISRRIGAFLLSEIK